MKDSGLMIEDMEKAMKDIVMVILMKENSKEVKLMAMVYIFGKMEKNMKEIGLMDINMDMDHGKVSY